VQNCFVLSSPLVLHSSQRQPAQQIGESWVFSQSECFWKTH